MELLEVSYDQWLEKLKRELKVDSLESHHVKIDEGLTTDPFFERIPKSDSAFRQEFAWNIKQVYDVINTSNADILRGLEGGINYVELQHADSLKNPKFLLENVELSYIKLHLHFSSTTSNDTVKSVLRKFPKDSNSISYHIEDSKIPIASAKIRFTSGLQEGLIDDLTHIFNNIIDCIDSTESQSELASIASKIEFERFLSSNIIQEISYLKAVRLLWNNVLDGFGLENIPLHTLATCLAPENLDLENKYIALSSKGLTAAIAGYQTIYIAPAAQRKKEFHERISKNIHHLLQSESFIQKSAFGMNGSFQVDKIAIEIAEAVWKNIGRI